MVLYKLNLAMGFETITWIIILQLLKFKLFKPKWKLKSFHFRRIQHFFEQLHSCYWSWMENWWMNTEKLHLDNRNNTSIDGNQASVLLITIQEKKRMFGWCVMMINMLLPQMTHIFWLICPLISYAFFYWHS